MVRGGLHPALQSTVPSGLPTLSSPLTSCSTLAPFMGAAWLLFSCITPWCANGRWAGSRRFSASTSKPYGTSRMKQENPEGIRPSFARLPGSLPRSSSPSPSPAASSAAGMGAGVRAASSLLCSSGHTKMTPCSEGLRHLKNGNDALQCSVAKCSTQAQRHDHQPRSQEEIVERAR